MNDKIQVKFIQTLKTVDAIKPNSHFRTLQYLFSIEQHKQKKKQKKKERKIHLIRMHTSE